ncbi:MAG: hypothetical protein IT357_07630 [Gemmatimonadaceae bacterium]|nr:hypothetical protein [Gemmatimonadaceae bacterium]
MASPRTWVVVFLGVVSCSHPPAPSLAPVPIDAVVTFGSRQATEHVFALNVPERMAWLTAPTIAVPEYTAFGLVAVGDTAAATQPFVFIVSGRRGAPGSLVIDGVPPSARSHLGGAEGVSVTTQPCIGANWVSAFFVEGIGAAPTAPVDVVFRADKTVYTIRLDPRRDVMKLREAPRLRAADVPTRIAADSLRVVSFRLGATKVGAVPVILARDDRRWQTAGRLTSTVEHLDVIARSGRGTAVEWVFLLLEPPPSCISEF